ncbi:hypothetical protein IJ182_01290 [bacterium]|nr:hypothetical protein [bacterium]
MLNENLQETPTLGLGVNAYEQKHDQQGIQGLENDGLFGKPEYYDYSEVELPENYCYDEELLGEFNELAGKYNLSQKGANQLMSLAVKLSRLTGDNISKTIAEQQRQQINEYKNALITDRELGGANYERTMRTANIAYTRFADGEVQNILQQTGLNCHPKVIRMFYNIGKQMQNDAIYGMGIAPAPKENREDILFPTMQ